MNAGQSQFSFAKLNHGWNAEPNAPDPTVEADGADIVLRFFLNSFQFPQFEEEAVGILRFRNCSKYRLGSTNDEGWYRGQCRFSDLAPQWGEFYEVSGDPALLDAPTDWKQSGPPTPHGNHYLFYFRDDTFECIADDWCADETPVNALRAIVGRTKISWKLPWRPLQFKKEIPGVQRQLEGEITPVHPLWGKNAEVIGRRIDCDDMLVALNDGTYANVHLVWGSGPGAFPAEYPSTVIYRSLGEFLAEMVRDAADYGEA